MIDFAKVEQSVKKLKQQVSDGQIDQSAFEDRLVALIDYAVDGYYWMFGHKTERWYRHDGTQWLPDDPGNLRYLNPSQNGGASEFSLANPQQNLTTLWKSINWGWFIASVIILGGVAVIVYNSSPL